MLAEPHGEKWNASASYNSILPNRAHYVKRFFRGGTLEKYLDIQVFSVYNQLMKQKDSSNILINDTSEASSEAIKEKRRKNIARTVVIAVVAVSVVLSIILGQKLIEFVREPAAFREFADSHKLAPIIYIAVFVVQIIFAVIPGEPLEILAGIAFGTYYGMFLALLGATIGAILVFLLVRKFGYKYVELFYPREKIEQLPIVRTKKGLHTLIFFLYLMPGTPKDVMNYAAALTPITLGRFLALTTLARIPSIITSTIGGDAIGQNKTVAAIVVFVATGAVSLICILIYNYIGKKLTKEDK